MGVSLFGAPLAPLANEKLEQVLGLKSIDFFQASATCFSNLAYNSPCAISIDALHDLVFAALVVGWKNLIGGKNGE
ncbi:MAG: hypothetical protein WAK66_03020 [Methylocystis sp.]